MDRELERSFIASCQLDAARTLAEDCRRRLRYVSPHPTILTRLFEFFNEHGPPEIAASLRKRII